MRKTKRALRSCIAIVAVLAMLFLVGCNDDSFGPGDEKTTDEIKYEGEKYVAKKNVESFLVIGLDKFEGEAATDSYNNDQQADFLMLFVFDNDAKTCTALHINRDTIANVNVLDLSGNKTYSLKQQIALSHTYGNGRNVSCRNVSDAVSELLMGVKVNHYISLKMDALPIFNDLVGGVEVEVLDDFSGIDDTLVKGDKVTLMGEHALRYVRTRKNLEDSSNSTRMKRQQQYINALYAKTQQVIAEDEKFIVEASLEMSDYIVSDRSVTQLQTLANKFNTYEFLGIKDIQGESKLGDEYIEFYPDEKSVKDITVELFYELKK